MRMIGVMINTDDADDEDFADRDTMQGGSDERIGRGSDDDEEEEENDGGAEGDASRAAATQLAHMAISAPNGHMNGNTSGASFH
jgi:hypothetical protein